MRKPAIAVALLVVVGVVGVWWWKSRGTDETGRSQVTQGSGSSAKIAPAPKRTAASSSITVTVTDERGPVAEASVRIEPDEGEIVVVKTDKDGVARAGNLGAHTYAVAASATGHVPAQVARKALAEGEDAKLDVKLALGGRILSGTVTDVNGGPIGGARIDAAKLDGRVRPGAAVATTFTGGDGKYQMTVDEGQLVVGARSLDYAPQTRYVEVGATGATADFALVPGGVIEGTVRDEKTKQPIAGAEVEARRDTGSEMMLAEAGGHHVVANADGKFRISGLRPGAYELDASFIDHGLGLRSKTPTIVGLGVAENVVDVELLVGAAAVVRGIVLDERDQPVANARIVAMGEGRGRGQNEATSDSKGAFTLAGLLPGNYMLFASTDTAVAANEQEVELKDKDKDGVTLRVKRGLVVKGHVEPRQIADVRFDGPMRIGSGMSMMSLMVPHTTGEDGEFSFGPMDPGGKATITARCASGDQGSVEVKLEDGMPEAIVKVAPSSSIAGRVLDGDGKPVAGATVSAAPIDRGESTMIVNGRVTSGVQVVANATGAYEVKGLAAGTYRMSALEGGRPLRMRKATMVSLGKVEKKTGVDLAVDRANGMISGVVLGPDGAPLADAWVSVHQSFDAMLAGARPTPPEAGQQPTELAKSTTMVMVEENDAGGGGGGGDIPPVLTDAQGRFTIANLAHSSYEVIGEAQGGKLRGRVSGVTPDATVTIKVLGVTTLSGTVHGPNGPTALFTLEVDGPTRTQRTFTDGAFSLGRVDPGAYTVRVRSSDGNGEAKVTVEPGVPATVDIPLVANATVVGTIVDKDGKPLPDMPVALVEDTGTTGGVRVEMSGPPPVSGPDGKFRIEHKAGKMTLLVLTGTGRPTMKRGLVLEPGKTLDAGTVQVDAPGTTQRTVPASQPLGQPSGTAASL